MLHFCKNQKLFAATILSLSIGCGIAYVISPYLLLDPNQPDYAELNRAATEAQLKPDDMRRTTEHEITSGSSVGQSLTQAGLSHQTAHALVAAAAPVKSLSRVPAKLSYKIEWRDVPETLATAVTFAFSASEHLQLTRSDDNTWTAELINKPYETKSETFSGIVISNLWDSARESGMDPQLITELATIFAWQVDFNREVRADDRWRIVVERLYIDRKPVRWGNILAAEYDNHGEIYSAVRYQSNDDARASYYAPDGSSLKRMFLKSPIKFGRISSTFKLLRLHPILGRNIPHNGVDYAAPTGTPIMAVGKGRIEYAGRNGGSGIMLKIRHNAVYTTAYLHLSRIAGGITRGSKVEQGDIIGYVGSTGLATGPHLHFAFYENGRFVDPLGKKFPSADPVASRHLTAFQTAATTALAMLPIWKLPKKNLAKLDQNI